MLTSDKVVRIDPSFVVRLSSYLVDGAVGSERRRVGELGVVISIVVRCESKQH